MDSIKYRMFNHVKDSKGLHIFKTRMGYKWLTLFVGGAPKSLQMVIAAMKFKDAYSLEGKLRPT